MIPVGKEEWPQTISMPTSNPRATFTVRNQKMARFASVVLLSLSCFSCEVFSAAAADASALDGQLRVMTYNLRFAGTNRPNAWPDRRPLMRELIQSASPDIIGTQEGLFGQLNDM